MEPVNLPSSSGNRYLKKHLQGDRITQRQMILAKCADCMGYYFDGRLDCEMPDCPLYPLMPYGKGSFRVGKATRKPVDRKNKKIEAVSTINRVSDGIV